MDPMARIATGLGAVRGRTVRERKGEVFGRALKELGCGIHGLGAGAWNKHNASEPGYMSDLRVGHWSAFFFGSSVVHVPQKTADFGNVRNRPNMRPIPAWQCELHSARIAAQW